MSTKISKEWLEKTILEGHINCYEYEKFTKVEKIGAGGFGDVSKHKWEDTELIVALKCLRKVDNANTSREIIHNFISELKLLKKVFAHPNIISFYGVTLDKGCYYMILQYANKGNLRQYLESNFKSLQWDNKLRIAREIVSGLMFLHNENIIHRDLHSKNILIHDDQPQITDFGLSQQINETSKTSNSVLNGMDQYIEPLCFKDKHYKRDKRSDIYSFGIILWEISSGKPPSFNPVFMIITGEKEEPIYGTPPQYIELYKKCWDNNPINRPDTKSILNKLNHLISNETSIKNNESPYLQVRTGEGASKQKTNRQDASILNQYLGETSSRNNEFIIEISSKQNANANAPIIPPPAINIPTSAPIYLPKAPNSPSSISSDSNQQKESTNSSVAKSFIKNLSFFFPARSHNESSSNEIQSSPPYQINDQEKINLNKDIENSLRDKTQTSLNLKKSQLGPDETKELSKVLAKFSNLTLLNLSWNHLGPEGGKVLAQVLFMLTKLETLNLTNNKLGPEGGKAIAEALSTHQTLTNLNLCINNLGPEGGIALAKVLCKDTKLKTLNLTNNKLHSEGGKAIANAIINNKTLTTLSVSNNNIGPEGGKAFAEVIKKNQTLESLSLDKNQLGPEAGIALANAISSNITLNTLFLNENNFGEAAKKSLNKSRNAKTLKNFEVKK